MNNAKIKITVNILSSKSHVNNMNNVHNMPGSSLQKSLPIIRTISINNNNRNHNSKSIPKDIYHKNKVLKLSSDETPTFDMESSRNSSFITKHQPQTVQITKPRILSVIWAKSNNNNSNNNNICSNPLVNYTSPVKQQQSEVNDDDDASNFLNYNLGDLNNDSESVALSAIKDIGNNNNTNNNEHKCCINNNFHLITNFTSVRNYKNNQHVYKNSSLKEMEFELSNISSRLFTFDDFNTSYSRSVYNNDISEMKPNENINNVYKMNTCFTYTHNRNNNNNIHTQYKSKGVIDDNNDKQKIKIINGFYSDYTGNGVNSNVNNNKNAKSCQKFSFTKDKGRKGVNTHCNNNNNKHVDYKKGNVNKHKIVNNNTNSNNKCLNRGINKNVNKRYDNNNVMNHNNTNNRTTLMFNGFVDKKFANTNYVTKKRNNGICIKDNNIINKRLKTFEKM